METNNIFDFQEEKDLQQSEQHFRLLIESARDYAIFAQDPQRLITKWNHGAEMMMGYAESEIIGELADIIFTQEDRAEQAPVKEAEKAEKEGRAENERWHVRKDGSRFWGSGIVNSIRDTDGRLLGFVKIMRDLTERKQAEEALHLSEERFRTLADAIPQLVWTNDEAGKATYFNKRWFEYSGLTYEQSEGRGWEAIVHPDDAQASTEQWKKALEAGELFDTEYRLQRADGMYRWHLGRNVPLKADTGKILGWFGTATDITEQKNFEEELSRQVAERTRELQRSNEDLQQFATIASHDLQEPLRKLKMFASVLQQYKEMLPVEGKDVIGKITVTSERMSQLIRQVLQYSRLSNGALEFVPADLDAILKEVLNDLELQIKGAGAAIIFDQALPKVSAIHLQIAQVFHNLLTNSLKYRKEGVPPVIRIEAVQIPSSEVKKYPFLPENKDYIKIIISDNGIGFDDQFAEQIFQIFERLHSVDEYDGNGVGLALCKKIVENHGGHIFATSKYGDGASFSIILPVSH